MDPYRFQTLIIDPVMRSKLAGTMRGRQRDSGKYVVWSGNYVFTFTPLWLVGKWLSLYRLSYAYHG